MALPLPQLIGSFLSVALGLTLCLVSTILVAIIYRRFLHPLSGIPGPFLASITDLWRLYFTFYNEKSWEQVEISLHQKYGPLVRIAPNVISIADAGCINPIYGHKSRFVKSNWYDPHGNLHNKNLFNKTDPDNKNLFNETNPQLHAEKRRKVASLYSMSAIHQMESRVDEVCSIFQKKLDKFASSGQPLDLGLWVQMYAFDVIGEITYGKTFGLLEDEADKNNYIQALGSSFPVLVAAGFFPFLLSLMRFPIFWSFVPGGQEISQDSSRLFQLVDSSVHERLQRPKSWKTDMLGQLLEAQENGKKDIALTDILMLGGGNIGAGSDTTAIALRAIFYFLLKNPHCYQKLQAEIDEADKEGKLSPFVTFTEANSLPYLCAVVMEATRLHPSVGYLLERVVPEEGSQLSGAFFKQGTIVGMNPFVVHRDTVVFGSNAAEFVPERWLNAEDAKVMSRYLLTFGYGSRSCIGKNISLMEMHKLVPQLMRNFAFSLVDPQREWTVKTFWFSFQKDVLVYVKRRNRDSVN